jgi:hypothetical protein
MTPKGRRAKRLEDLEERLGQLQRARTELPPLWTPFSNSPQELAYHSEPHEILFGGAAGAGKSSLGVGLALMKHQRSLILRRQAVQAVEIADQLKRFALGRGRWSGRGHGGVMVTDEGRVIEVGGCDLEDDWYKYAGRPHDLIVFDESTHFTLKQFRHISAWNRHEDPQQLCQVLLPTNPPTSPEGRWIVEEFAPWLDPEYSTPARPGELRWYTVIEDKVRWLDGPEPFEYRGETIKPRSRTFIPGRLTDNPILAAGDYGSRLQALPEPLRSQLLYGDFSLRAEDDVWQVIPTAWVRAAMARWTEQKPEGARQDCIGLDVARGGRDQTVISRRYGSWFARLLKYPGAQTPDGPSAATLAIRAHEDGASVNVDVIGIGASAYDVLKEQRWLKVLPVNNSEAKVIRGHRDRSGRMRFSNVRAASWWRLREALDPNGPEKLALPPDNELLADLCAPRYKVLTSGIQIEAKEDVAARLGRSIDCGDAVVLAYWSPYRTTFGLRIYALGQPRQAQGVALVASSLGDLEGIAEEIVDPCLLALLQDPGTAQVPVPRLPQLLGSTALQAADLEPEHVQSRWGEPLEPWGRPPEELLLTPQIAKPLWRLLLASRPAQPRVYLFADGGAGDRRALSTACAVADSLRIPRACVWQPAHQGEDQPEPGNKHWYQTVRTARSLVLP